MTLEQFVENYNSKEIVAWMHYDPDWRHNSTGEPTKKFRLYPRFIREEFSTLAPIEQNIEIEVRTTGSEHAENVYSRYGKLVIFSIKASLELQSFRIPDKPFLRYNASYGKFESDVWIEQFPDKEYYQIISCDMSVETLIRKRHISKNN